MNCMAVHLWSPAHLIHILQEAPENILLTRLGRGIRHRQTKQFVHTIIKYGPETMKTKVLALADAQRWLELIVLEPLLKVK